MKTLKKLNEREVKEVVKKIWEDFKMREWTEKNYDFYKTEDELIIEVKKAKNLCIRKTIWYDDELPEEEIPNANLENFISYNEYNCNRYDFYKEYFDKSEKFYFIKNDETVFIDYKDIYGEKNIIREIKEDEKQDILEIYKNQKEQYIERLKKYFSKYNKYIRAEGYWRNR